MKRLPLNIRTPEWLNRRLRGLSGIALPVLLLSAAMLTSDVFGEEILATRPWPPGPISVPALALCTFLGMAIVLLHYRYRVFHEKVMTLDADLIAVSKKVDHAMRRNWIPPQAFEKEKNIIIKVVRTLSADISEAHNRGRLSRERVDWAIRCVLQAIANLARLFDGFPPSTEYCANLMIYREAAEIRPEEEETVRGLLVFCDRLIDIYRLRGILELDVRLSSATDVKSFAEDPRFPASDPQLKAFALPVLREEDEWTADDKQRFLPGAPAVFQTQRPRGLDEGDPLLYICSDTYPLGDVCERECDLSPAVIKRMRAYFRVETGNRIRSFVSLALKRDGQPMPWGVLNLHRSTPDILVDEKNADEFFRRTVDLTSTLGALIELRGSLPPV